MRRLTLASAVLAASISSLTQAEEPVLGFTKLWTHGHTTAGQVSEIPAFDSKTNTIWVAGVVGVDVLDAATGTHFILKKYKMQGTEFAPKSEDDREALFV